MEVFVARQPIFNKQLKVYGYELLYRLGANDYYDGTDGDRATSEVISNSFLLIGLEKLTGGKRAFINFTENLLKSEIPAILPPKLVAVEVLEDVQGTEEIVIACRKLKQLGYTMVLDDFIYNHNWQALIDYTDIIKIDFLTTPEKERKEIMRRIGPDKVKYLAEKVETIEAYKQAAEEGFTYFQGYFFSKPAILSSRDVPVYKLNYLQILQEVNRLDMDYGRLEGIIKRDVSMSYKLLKFINSASFGFRTRIQSIKHALVMLGITEIRKWVSLIALRSLADEKPDEIMASSIIRARFGELIAPKLNLGPRRSDLFLMGLFSMIDVIMGRPMSAVLEGLPISEDISDALLGREGTFRNVLELVKAYEKAEWDTFALYAQTLKIKENEVPEIYFDSLEWANRFINGEITAT